jgi:TonB family protein
VFLHYFGLREQPFGVTPDPGFLYLSDTHREALASLIYGIEAGIGFSAVIAKPGMGKTTLLYALLKYFQSSSRSAFLFDTQCDSRELIQNLLEEFEIDGEVQARGMTPLATLRQFLLRSARAKRQVLVVVDEAQNLETSTFETLRLLSNFETAQTKLLQIILSGQPQLGRKLASPELEQLRQRISTFCHLKEFTPNETVRYIAHRLRLAGYDGTPIFTPEALGVLVANSFGTPREINRMCFNALSLGFAMQKRVIDAEIICEVIADLEVEGLLTRRADSLPAAESKVDEKELAALFGSALGTGCKEGISADVVIDPGKDRDIRNRWFDGGEHPLQPQPAVAATRSGVGIGGEFAQSQRDGDESGRALESSGIVTLGLSAPNSSSVSRRQNRETRMGAILRRCGLTSFWSREESSQRLGRERLPLSAAIRNQRPETNVRDEITASTLEQRNPTGTRPNFGPSCQATDAALSCNLLRRVYPVYPQQARAQGLAGQVMLDAHIRNNGKVGEVYALSGHPMLTAAAIDAVRQWVYTPPMRNGEPQSSRKIIVVEFSLR